MFSLRDAQETGDKFIVVSRKRALFKTKGGLEAWRPGARIGALELNHEGVSDAYTTDMRGLGEPSGGLELELEPWS